MATAEVLMSLPSTLFGLSLDGKQENKTEREGPGGLPDVFKLEHVFVRVQEAGVGKRRLCWLLAQGEGFGPCSFSGC